MLIECGPGVHHTSQEHNFVTMVDCGGGTIDLSTYHIVGDLPITVEESTIPDCMGGISEY